MGEESGYSTENPVNVILFQLVKYDLCIIIQTAVCTKHEKSRLILYFDFDIEVSKVVLKEKRNPKPKYVQTEIFFSFISFIFHLPSISLLRIVL